MNFSEKLNTYAQLLVTHGLNIQRGQVLNIMTETYHRDFALLVAEAAYRRGARFVDIEFTAPQLARRRIELSSDEDLKFVPAYTSKKYSDIVRHHAANLKILGSEFPEVLADLDPKKVNTVRLNHHLAVKEFYDEGIGKSLVHWTVAAAATPAWGKKLFPQEGADQAEAQLWEQIFRITRSDHPDCLELWQAHSGRLQQRAERLTAMEIDELHFTGPGTDLVVALSPLARFKGGCDVGPHGVEFEPNIPTEEVFTTPDWRRTQGQVRTTRPFLINGKLIQDLKLRFDKGKIVEFSASDGEETFGEYIDSDDGARNLGEVALVGIDSPVYQSGLVFEEILYDENAACHLAIGSAYKFCLVGGESMSKEQLAEVGCNESSVHTDMMISSDEVDVTAQTRSGERQVLISQGRWQE